MSTIKDSKLASVGKDEVNWAQRQMQVLEDIKLDFEKRKLAEQRATRRLKGENVLKENKTSKQIFAAAAKRYVGRNRYTRTIA